MALTEIPSELSSTPSIVDNGNSTAITIDSSENATFAGSVGIGTAPASLLDVSSTGEVVSTVRSTSTSGARQATLRLNVPSTGGDDPAGRVQFTYGTGYTVAGSIEMSHTNSAMKFLSGTTEAMRLSGGNLLVGKTSNTISAAGAKLGTGGSNFTRSGAEVVYFNRTTNHGAIATFAKDGLPVGSIGSFNGVPYIGYQGGTGGGIMFNGRSIEPTGLGGTRTDGANDIGTSGYRWKDLHLSGGVVFDDAGGSGTSSSNTLGEYEEGAATISILAASTNPSITQGNTFTGYYTRVGNVCTIIGYTGARNFTNTGVGNVRFSGLPFASKSGPYAIAQFTHNTFFTNSTAGYVETGSNYFYPIVDNSTPVASIAGTGTRYLMFSLTYIAA